MQLNESARLIVTVCSDIRMTLNTYTIGTEPGDGSGGPGPQHDSQTLVWDKVRMSELTEEQNTGCPSEALVVVTDWLEPGSHLLTIEPRLGNPLVEQVGEYSLTITNALVSIVSPASATREAIEAVGMDGGLLLSTGAGLWITHDQQALRGLATAADISLNGDFHFRSARKFSGIAYSPVTGRLYSPPYDARSVLVIDPVTNVTDTSAMPIPTVPSTNTTALWSSIAYEPLTQRLFAPPNDAGDVLVIDPATNSTSLQPITRTISNTCSRPCSGQRWSGIVFVPSTGKLYAAPACDNTVLVIDPVTNVADADTLRVQTEPYRCGRNNW